MSNARTASQQTFLLGRRPDPVFPDPKSLNSKLEADFAHHSSRTRLISAEKLTTLRLQAELVVAAYC